VCFITETLLPKGAAVDVQPGEIRIAEHWFRLSSAS
jgi:hypothetical protein